MIGAHPTSSLVGSDVAPVRITGRRFVRYKSAAWRQRYSVLGPGSAAGRITSGWKTSPDNTTITSAEVGISPDGGFCAISSSLPAASVPWLEAQTVGAPRRSRITPLKSPYVGVLPPESRDGQLNAAAGEDDRLEQISLACVDVHAEFCGIRKVAHGAFSRARLILSSEHDDCARSRDVPRLGPTRGASRFRKRASFSSQRAGRKEAIRCSLVNT